MLAVVVDEVVRIFFRSSFISLFSISLSLEVGLILIEILTQRAVKH